MSLPIKTNIPQLPDATQNPRSWLNTIYVEAATSDNTRKAYRSDIRHFEKWGGRLPATAEMITCYLQEFAPQLNPRTLGRRLIALSHWHTYQGFADPTDHPIISKTLRGMLRLHGKPKRQARPLMLEELRLIVTYLSKQTNLLALRDNALLQIGFFGALRRSELVAVAIEHIRIESAGMEILIPSSKTDPTHIGQFCVLPRGDDSLCPVRALKTWLEATNLTTGHIFPRFHRSGKMTAKAITPLTVNQIVKQRAHEAGIENTQEFSSHSLRRGLATCAARVGAPIQAIMRQGRWKQVGTVMQYIEASARFTENAAADVLNNKSSR